MGPCFGFAVNDGTSLGGVAVNMVIPVADRSHWPTGIRSDME